MASADTAIVNGILVLGDQIVDGGVALSDGIIVALGATASLPDAREVIDAEGGYILPGVIDPHVHFREPGLTNREDFNTGSRAATVGGVTTVFDMPNTSPPTASGELVREKRALIMPSSRVNFGLYGLVGQDNVDQIEGMAAAGVIGFKFFLHQTVEGVAPCDDGALFEAFQRIAATGRIAAVHAENPEIIGRCSAHLRGHGRHDISANIAARPTVSESEMVGRCIAYASAAGNKLHICHITSRDSVANVREARAKGITVTAETGPQWLWFTDEDAEQKGMVLMFSPPFRSDDHRTALWEGLADGAISMIATDHAPRFPEEKLVQLIWDSKSGFIGVETNVPLMLTAVEAGRMTMQEYAKLSSENAARTFGLYPAKGSLLPGTDADVTVVNFGPEKLIDSTQLQSKAKFTPFDGEPTRGVVVKTIVNGHVMASYGEILGTPHGKDVVLRS